MSIHVQQWNDEPIILMTVVERASEDDVIMAYSQSIELANSMSSFAYRVVDLRQAGPCYQDVIRTIRDLAKSLSGASIYPQMATVFVGTVDMIRTVDTANVRFFTQMDDAEQRGEVV